MQKSPSPQNLKTNIDFRTITALRASIRNAEAQWKDDFRFQKGIEKEKDLLKYFMDQII